MGKKTISKSFTVSVVEDGIDGVTYQVVWKDANGAITQIPCSANGVGKVIVGSGIDPWLTAMLYKSVGDGQSDPHEAFKVRLRVFLENGAEVGGDWPQERDGISYIFAENYEAQSSTHVKYVVEFYDESNNLLATSSIYRTKDGANGTNGTNGTSAPQYTLEYYAWSNVVSTASVTTSPFEEPYSGWSDSIPPQGSLAFLWKKIVLYTYNSGTNTYTAGTPQYYRMNGENGTTISVKGTVLGVTKYWAHQESDLPTSGETNGTLAWVEGTNYLLEYHESNTGWWSQALTLVNGDKILCCSPDFTATDRKKIYSYNSSNHTFSATATTVSDGHAYTEQFLGNLWQWSDEATNWLDLGQFKGESGKTYYTHIAWAENVTIGSPRTPAQGCLNRPNGSNIIHPVIVPNTEYVRPYMGYRIDEIAGSDSHAWTSYTWQKVQGEQGERGKKGRFFYYGGVFDANNSSDLFRVTDAVTPYFKTISGNNVSYHVFNPTENPVAVDNKITMSQMWDMTEGGNDKSFNNYPWEMMNDSFKYLITEAIFSSFAHLGGAIMNDPWMISQYGTINGVASQNFEAFDAGHPNDNTGTNFIPNFCVNLQTGETYQHNGYFDGTIKARNGEFSGYIKTNFVNIGNSDVIISGHNYKLNKDLNISVNFGDINDTILLPNDSSYIGAEVQFFAYPELGAYSNGKVKCEGNYPIFGYELTQEQQIYGNYPIGFQWNGGLLALVAVPPASGMYQNQQCQWVIKSFNAFYKQAIFDN